MGLLNWKLSNECFVMVFYFFIKEFFILFSCIYFFFILMFIDKENEFFYIL